MRILDLGAHDGFVSAYVLDQLAELGHGALRIDGVELNSHGVMEFNRRLKDRGAAGTCLQGLAEDAPTLFEPGSYDAVIAFELIEHVPDVTAFLDACEAMVAPGGRIYLSTPNGTFGEGQNPHHLRVYRAIDLADLLRRRGNLQSMAVGPDTITVAAYTPWHVTPTALEHGNGEVAIYTGAAWQAWSPLNIERSGGLGGSETAAARLADALTEQGWTVTVYGEVEPGMYGQVAYRHHSTFDPLTPRDMVIASRSPWLADRPISARTKVLWMHDTDYGNLLTPERALGFDAIAVLSTWHRGHVFEMYPFLTDDDMPRVLEVNNAIKAELFTEEPAPERNPHRYIYSSSPDRGLDLLLEWWPEVRERVPDAELVFCYADVYGAVAAQRPEVGAHHELVQRLAKQPGVTNLGALPQPMLANEMRKCGVWVHPSFNTPNEQQFYETFCIGAVEAAAAGCVLVCSNWGALQQRVDEVAVEAYVVDSTEIGSSRPAREMFVNALANAAETADKTPPGPSYSALACRWVDVAEDFVTVMQGLPAR